MRSSDSANAAEGSPNAAARLATSQASQAQRITRATVPRRSRCKLRSVGLGGARDGRSPSQGDPAVSFGRHNPNRTKKIHPTRWPHAVVSRKHRAALLRGWSVAPAVSPSATSAHATVVRNGPSPEMGWIQPRGRAEFFFSILFFYPISILPLSNLNSTKFKFQD